MGVLQLLSAASLMLLGSCASIMAGSDTSIVLDSVPSGVAFTTNYAGMHGVTPATLNVPNGDVLEVTFAAPTGYQQTIFTTVPTFSGWIWGNIVLGIGAPIGLAVDAINDNSRAHDDILVELIPVGATEAEGIPDICEKEPEA